MSVSGFEGNRDHRKVIEGLAVLAFVGIAVYLLKIAAEGDWGRLAMWSLALGIVFWTFASGEAWWMLLPAALGLGGTLNLGFKVYTHELALAISMLPLVPLLAFRKNKVIERAPLPKSLYLLLALLLVHTSVSLYAANLQTDTGIGSIVRTYVRALWPLVFAIPFFRYGSTRHLRVALTLLYVGSFVRCALGVVGYFFPRVASPTTTFLLPGIYSEGVELRESGLWLVYTSLAFVSLYPQSPRRFMHWAMAGLAGWFVVIGGSRVSLGMFCLIPLLWAAVQRRFVLLTSLVLLVISTLVAVNLNPNLLYQFPERFQRTLSILVMDSPFHELHRSVEGSNEWHYGLMQIGYQKWTQSPATFVFGNRVLPYREPSQEGPFAFFTTMQTAAGLGYYESGLWTVLAVLGVAGLLLYAGVFIGLLRPVVPALVRQGIRDTPHAFYFVATAGLIVWACFAWIAGHFPSEPLFMAVIARAAYEDGQRTAAAPPAVG